MQFKTIPLVLIVITAPVCPQLKGSTRPVPAPGYFRDASLEKKDESRIEAPTDLFEFHSSFWLNLHHFLYQQALVHSGNIRAARTRGEAPLIDRPLPDLDRTWNAAVDYYVASMIKRDLLFDQGMVDINARLAQLERVPGANLSGFDPTLISKLRGAAPVYESFWWKQHDLTNRAWVARIAPLLKQMGGEISAKLMQLYRTEWPKVGIRVEVATYANWAGAYTSDHPVLITLSSEDKADRGYEELETLFHEASHAFDPIQEDRIAVECRAQKRQAPRNLWHAMIFYTTGDVVKKTLAEHHLGPYTPYAYHYGIYERGWKDYLKALETDWQPYLDGKTDFDHALSRVVAAVARES